MTASELLMQFLLAVVSGLVAGLSAGWVLMRWQLRTQLASDDISRIIEMLHSLERIREKLAEAERQVLFGNVGAKDNLQSEMRSAVQALDEEVAARAQYLRARRHRHLRAYLVLRIRRGYFSREIAAFGHSKMGRALDELIEDVNEYVLGSRGLRDRWLALKQRMRTLPDCFKNRLSEKQRELLVQATMIENPRSVWDLLKGLPVSKDVWIEEHEAYPYFVAVKSLVSQGLFEDIRNETYSLTRKGWKKAVLVRKGKYDPRTDVSGKLTEYP